MNETITWIPTDAALPDDGETVLICIAPPEPEPVWIGWWDTSAARWMQVDGCDIAAPVSHWASMPAGPMECEA